MDTSVKRTFIPGDEWVYFKLYTGYKTADRILAGVFPGLTARLTDAGIISKWFFIRFADPDPHLRVRFLVNGKEHLASLVDQVNRAIDEWVKKDFIWKVQLDTYNRELERYGRNAIECAESIFSAESQAVVGLLDRLARERGEDIRWLLGLKMMDMLLDDFDLDMYGKKELAGRAGAYFKAEFGYTGKMHKVHLDGKYRSRRSKIGEVLDPSATGPAWLSPFWPVLLERSCNVRPVADTLRKMASQGKLEVPIHELLEHYAHMMVNRLFRTKQRLYEMVLYDFLYRHYNSALARKKKNAGLAEKEAAWPGY